MKFFFESFYFGCYFIIVLQIQLNIFLSIYVYVCIWMGYIYVLFKYVYKYICLEGYLIMFVEQLQNDSQNKSFQGKVLLKINIFIIFIKYVLFFYILYCI